MRRSEATRQAAILNALPAHVALLDAQGRIVSVNDAWRRFAIANGMIDPTWGVGSSYLAECTGESVDPRSDASQACAGIRAVLDAQVKAFSLEYPCDSPTEQRWFLLSVAPLNQNHANGAVVMHLDITERKQNEADLHRFAAAMDATLDAIYVVDRTSMRFIYLNDAACRLQGRTREELFAQTPASAFGVAADELEKSYDTLIDAGVETPAEETLRDSGTGTHVWVEVRRHAHRFGGRATVVTLIRDISARKDAEQRLHHLAHYDALTGLPNRTLFYETLKRAALVAAENGWRVAVLCVDLDHFKDVNDSLGHAFGDGLLRQFAERLVQCVRTRDTIGRLGGDEFAMLLLMKDETDAATAVATKIRDVMRAPFDLGGHEATVTVSTGIAIFPEDATDPQTLLKYADTAMYRTKQAGRDTFRFFTAQMNVEVLARVALEAALRRAVENNEFTLHYQPRVQLASGRMAGLEALLRWDRPGQGPVSPSLFVPVLEETGLIVRVGSWVIGAVCRQIGLWMRTSIGAVQVSINVSGRQFIEGDLEGDVLKGIADNQLGADQLELELTESSLMANTERTMTCLRGLRARGVQIAIDDFGTGYSSLAYLRRFPIDRLKIDIVFIRDVISNPDAAAIVLAIIRMAHSLKLEVVAEGVEIQAQMEFLRRNGCDHMQGHYFSEALAPADIEQLLRDDKRLPPSVGAAQAPVNTLLLVDDERNVLTSLQRLLREDGYRVLSAQTATEGFELLALHPVQVILCDQRMPEMSGTDFLDRIKELYPDTLRIILSGYTDLKSIIDAINRGSIYRFYTKPWDNQVLRDNIREAFRYYWLLHDLGQRGEAKVHVLDLT